MQCVTPMFRVYNSSLKKDSNAIIVPRSRIIDGLNWDPNYIRHCVDQFNEQKAKGYDPTRVQTIACSYCWACKLRKSAEWASRIILECMESPWNYWLTLTYDDLHLPIYEQFTDGEYIYDNDGTWNGTLEPEDVTRFINSLRKYYERKGIYNIRYFYCGEYGEKTARPHYHLCLFGAPLDPEQFYDLGQDPKNHYFHWKSKELDKYWQHGFCDVYELEFSNAAYTARYTMKKIFNEPKSESEYAALGKIKEFVRMSRRPGIGMKYFEKNMDKIYDTDELILKTCKGNVGVRKPPKAFDRKFQNLFPDKWELILDSRQKAAERSNKLLKELTDATDKQLLIMKTEDIIRIGNNLPRILE